MSCVLTKNAFDDNDDALIELNEYMAIRDKPDTLNSDGLGYYQCYCKTIT